MRSLIPLGKYSASGGTRGGSQGPAPLPLLLHQTEALETAPQYLRVWMTDPPTPSPLI